MLGVRLVDWMVIIVYLVGITFIGLWAVRKVRSSASFFIGDRKFGKLMMAFFMFGSGTHSDQAVTVAAKTYRAGASGTKLTSDMLRQGFCSTWQRADCPNGKSPICWQSTTSRPAPSS